MAKEILESLKNPTPEVVAEILETRDIEVDIQESSAGSNEDSATVSVDNSSGLEKLRKHSGKAWLAILLLGLGLKGDSRNFKSEILPPTSDKQVEHYTPDDGETKHASSELRDPEEVSKEFDLEAQKKSLKRGIWGYSELRLKELTRDNNIIGEEELRSLNYLLMEKFLDYLQQSGTIPEGRDPHDWSRFITDEMIDDLITELGQKFTKEYLLEWLGQ